MEFILNTIPNPLMDGLLYYEKGSKAVLLTNTGRKRINMNGALDVKSLEVITVSSDSIHAQSTIELFKKLEEKYPLLASLFS
jgi:hypothetical protein